MGEGRGRKVKVGFGMRLFVRGLVVSSWGMKDLYR